MEIPQNLILDYGAKATLAAGALGIAVGVMFGCLPVFVMAEGSLVTGLALLAINGRLEYKEEEKPWQA